MPIHYRSLTTIYRDIPLRTMQENVEQAEYLFSLFLAGKIDDHEFFMETGYFFCACENASLSEVFSQDASVSEFAQELVNRSEMMHRARELVAVHWRDEEGNAIVGKKDNFSHFCKLVVTLEPCEIGSEPVPLIWDGHFTLRDLPQPAA